MHSTSNPTSTSSGSIPHRPQPASNSSWSLASHTENNNTQRLKIEHRGRKRRTTYLSPIELEVAMGQQPKKNIELGKKDKEQLFRKYVNNIKEDDFRVYWQPGRPQPAHGDSKSKLNPHHVETTSQKTTTGTWKLGVRLNSVLVWQHEMVQENEPTSKEVLKVMKAGQPNVSRVQQ